MIGIIPAVASAQPPQVYPATRPPDTPGWQAPSPPAPVSPVVVPPVLPVGQGSVAPAPAAGQPAAPQGSSTTQPGAASQPTSSQTSTESAPPTPTPPAGPSALPALPPGAGMGGFPSAPAPLKEASSVADVNSILRDALTVRLRDGGVLRPYGFFRADLDFATNKLNDIQNPFFVLSTDPRATNGTGNVPNKAHDPNYSLYPRLTRLGLEYYGKKIEDLGLTPSGRVEIDFNTVDPVGNGVNSESRQLLRLRLAYGQLQWGEFTFVGGQDWDIVSPLVPTINDNTLMWNTGNTGDRRPQAKLLWDHDLGDGLRVQVQNGLALGDAITNNDLDLNGYRDQEDSALPAYEGRLGVVIPTVYGANQPILAGIWGLLGKEVTNRPIGRLGHTQFVEKGIGYDLRVPITCDLAFQSEGFYGRNLDDFRGGIGQGINTVIGQTIRSRGGWAELVYRPVTLYQVSGGVTADDPFDSDLPAGGRRKNYAWYVGNRFALGNGILVGADYVNWTTEYIGLRTGHVSLIKLFTSVGF